MPPRARPPRDRQHRFVNWSRTEVSAAVPWHLPTTEAAVVELVRHTRRAGRRLRVVGAGHSFSAIAVPGGDAVSLDRLQLPALVDRRRGTVTVSAGMRLRDLSMLLHREGLALPILGSIQAQSVGGAIATGTHGSSLVHGNLASLVVAMSVVTGTGEVLSLDGDDPRLDGARVHVGALGAVTQVTLPVRPARRLHQSIEQVPIHEVPAALADIAASAEYVKVWWLPHAPLAQVVRYTATDAPATRGPTIRRWVDERLMHRLAFPAMIRLQHRRPQLVAGLNTWLSSRYLGPPSQVGRAPLMLNTPMPVRHRETEAAVPVAEAGTALEKLLDLFDGGRPAANFPLEIRFVRGDAGWLSPASGGDTCQIGAYSTDGPDCGEYFEGFWKVMRPVGARPHWGKELDHDAGELRGLYPAFDRFLALRAQLDPDRLFGNAFLARVLGD